jgi:hypothetical protein
VVCIRQQQAQADWPDSSGFLLIYGRPAAQQHVGPQISSVTMASKFRCTCGEIIRTNLYSGNNMQLLVPEEVTNLSEAEMKASLDGFVDELVRKSLIVAECPACKAIAFIDNNYNIKMYAPVSP